MHQVTLPFATMTDDEVRAALQKYSIGLTVEEAKKIEELLKRSPTVTEAVIWGIQGSEHCSYKSSRRFLKQFPTEGTHVILGPKEDSGIIAITDGPKGKRWGIVISHESHNHPSQVVPYEGAATGVGGCVRDVLCMGARVIGALDSLRLGDLKTDETRAIATEVIRGVAGYANPLGIPNLGGDTVFDSAYNSNCLVNVVALGLIREDEIIHSYVQGEAAKEKYDIIMVGKATDRSGFGGAAFASLTMDEDDHEKNSGAVQEPNPFLERHLLASTYALFDIITEKKLLDKVSFKDLGAGGNVCASVEQVAPLGFGAIVNLDSIHVAIPNLPAEVIACAETQERFCWVCHPDLTEMILSHYNKAWDLPSVAEGARASVVGKVTEDGIYTLVSKGEAVCSASSESITSGLQYTRPTNAPMRSFKEPVISYKNAAITVEGNTVQLKDVFLSLLSHPSYASKARVFRHYDKNIIGNTLIEAGEADASVIAPLRDLDRYGSVGPKTEWSRALTKEDQNIGVAFASGGNGRYGRISPYLQGVNALIENARNVACVGAVPRALSDCLNYGNPEIPEHLWALEEGVRGIADAARGLTLNGEALPVVSGNVSLYNTTKDGSIDPTAIVCVVGVMPDAEKAIHGSFKSPDSLLYVLGNVKDECGGSAYYKILESMLTMKKDSLLGANVPSPVFSEVVQELQFLTRMIQGGTVLTAHDCSEGGLALNLFEMTSPIRRTGGSIGYAVDLQPLSSALRPDTLLFSESGAIIVEISVKNREIFEKAASDTSIAYALIGKTIETPTIEVRHDNEVLLSGSLETFRQPWSSSLEHALGSV